jgi:hypothetical protein
MSNRFHNKFHRFNHHSAGSPDPKYPDAGYDPIASFDSPFQGEFYSEGDIITTQNLSAGIDLTVDRNALIRNNLVVGYDANVRNDLFVDNNFTVSGSSSNIDTLVYITSAVDIYNSGVGPALRVNQLSSEQIVHFVNDGVSSFIVDARINSPGFVGINTETPSERLTVVGNISAVGSTHITENLFVSGNAFIQGNLAVDSNVFFVDVSANKVGINTQTPNEALTIVGNISAVGNTITTANVYVSGNQQIDGTLQVGTVPTGATDNVITLSGDLFETRLINSRVWDTTAEFLSARNLTANYLPRYTSLNTLENSTIRDQLTSLIIANDVIIQGTLNALGSASFVNTIFTTTSSISVVNLGEGPALYVFQASGPHDVASFYDGDGIEVLHVGNAQPSGLGRIGINTGEPNVELTVNGSISATGNVDITGRYLSGGQDISLIVSNIVLNSDLYNMVPLSGGSLTGIIKPNTVLINPSAVTELPLTGNDIEFLGQISDITITSFLSGTRGVTYTLTNKETYSVTISSSPTIYVRGGNNWLSNASNYVYSSIVLLSGYSCSLRADSSDVVSVW